MKYFIKPLPVLLIFMVLFFLLWGGIKEYNKEKIYIYKVSHYSNGFVKSKQRFKYDTIQDGNSEEFYSNGSLSKKTNYKNGKKHGKEEIYFKNGNIKFTCNYKEGQAEGKRILYYITGQIRERGFYINGKKHGKEEEYFENGNLKYTCNFIGGQAEGKLIRYYSTGQIRERCFYRNDEKIGSAYWYFENGTVEAYIYYVMKSKVMYRSDYDTLGNLIEEKGYGFEVVFSESVLDVNDTLRVTIRSISPPHHKNSNLYVFWYDNNGKPQNKIQAESSKNYMTIKNTWKEPGNYYLGIILDVEAQDTKACNYFEDKMSVEVIDNSN
jgi:antitoxin component YwqK of YwqJK toxin-antitoxin module